MRGKLRAIALSLLVFALFYTAFWDSGFQRIHWTIALGAIALAGFLCFIPPPRNNSARLTPSLSRAVVWPMLLLPAYVGLQLIPLPIAWIRWLSPTRAQSLDALGRIMPAVRYAAISVNSATTWENLVRIVGYLAVLVLMREFARRSGARCWNLAWPIIALAAFEAVLGIVQMTAFSSETRAQIVYRGTYLNRDHYSALLEMAFPFALIAIFATFQKVGSLSMARVLRAALTTAAALLILLGILGALSRIGPVACGAAVFVAIVTALARRLPALGTAVLAIVAGVLILGSFLYLAPAALIERYDTTDSSEPRWGIWRDSVHLDAHYPATGSGLGTFYDTFQAYQTSDVIHAYIFAHNDYLQVLGELGIPGFLIVAILIGGVAFRAIRVIGQAGNPQARSLALACLGAMVALLVHSFVDFIAYVPADALVLAWILGIASGLPTAAPAEENPDEDKPPPRPLPRPAFFRRYALTASTFLLVYGAAWLVFETRLRADPVAEHALCPVGLCDNDGLVSRALQSLNTASAPATVKAGFDEAMRRTPDAPLLWLEMAEVERRAGAIDQAKFCQERAHVLAPNSPLILWELVTAKTLLGEQRQAFPYASAVLGSTRVFDQTIFQYFFSMKIPVLAFLNDILPQNAEAARAYMRFLISRSDLTGAPVVWNWMLARGYADAPLANEWVAFLLNANYSDLAARSWAEYLGNRAGDYRKTNALFNGDFELPPSGSLLDWTIVPVKGATIAFDSAVHFSGNRALRICFDGVDFSFFDHVWQVFAIEPGGVYQLEAQVRSKNLVPGIQLRVMSWPEEEGMRALTAAPPQSSDWTRIRTEFTVPKNVDAARIDVIHQAAAQADQSMGGCLWIDQVRLERIR